MTSRSRSGLAPVPIRLSEDQAAFLRCELLTACEALRADLAEFPEQFPDPAGAHRELAAYGRLLAGIERGHITPDRMTLSTLRHLGESIDAANEFQRALFEHRAAQALLRRLEAGRRR